MSSKSVVRMRCSGSWQCTSGTCRQGRWLSKWKVREASADPENLCSLTQVYHSPNSLMTTVGRNDREQVTVPPPRGNRRPPWQQGNTRHPSRTVWCFTFSMWFLLYSLQEWGLGALNQGPIPLWACGACRRRCTLWFPAGTHVQSQLPGCMSMYTFPADYRLSYSIHPLWGFLGNFISFIQI